MNVDTIRKRLRTHRPVLVDGDGWTRAAVAVILREGAEGAEFVAIRRSDREGDPWSGHMAFPGGRQHPSDRDLLATAVRETQEEVGIDLAQHGQPFGRLDDLRAMARGRPLDMVISPVVFAVTHPVTLVLNPHEVHTALWVPLLPLARGEARGTFRHDHEGQTLELEAFVYEGHTIWGLTYRILTGLLEVLRGTG